MTPENKDQDKFEEVVSIIEFDLTRANKQQVLQLLRREAEKCNGCQNSAIWNILAGLTCDSQEFDWHVDDFVNDQIQIQENLVNFHNFDNEENPGEKQKAIKKKYLIYFCVAAGAFAIGYWIGKRHFKTPPPPPSPAFLPTPAQLENYIHPYIKILKNLWIF